MGLFAYAPGGFLYRLTNTQFHRSAHAGMPRSVSLEVPKLVTLGEFNNPVIGNDGSVNHDESELGK